MVGNCFGGTEGRLRRWEEGGVREGGEGMNDKGDQLEEGIKR